MEDLSNNINFIENNDSTSINFLPFNESPTQPFSNFEPNPNQISYSFEDEPPLWEELGIDFQFIKSKTFSLLNPIKKPESVYLTDTDLGGPFLFCLIIGFCLLFTGKVHFGYIFGYTIFGSLILYALLNLLCEGSTGVNHTISVLGYCQLPLSFLALLSILFPPTNIVGFLIAMVIIGFCTYRATITFVNSLNLTEQQYLIAYPVGLLYTCFALIVMF